MNVPASNS